MIAQEDLLKKTAGLTPDQFLKMPLFGHSLGKERLSNFLKVSCLHDHILVQSRYTKLSRVVSQTPWLIEGSTVIVKSSVQDEISNAIRYAFLPADGTMFLHASGREDIDVRMLGDGRPFIFEIVNPRRALSCYKHIDELKVDTPYVKCKKFRIVSQDVFDHLKDVEASKAKRYAAVVHTSEVFTEEDCAKLNEAADLEILQQTPVRVLHRRS